MHDVVTATCPGCKQLLRIPADWLHEPMRCKHCGLTFLAKSKTGAPPLMPQAASSAPVNPGTGNPYHQPALLANASLRGLGNARPARASASSPGMSGWLKGALIGLGIAVIASTIFLIWRAQLSPILAKPVDYLLSISDPPKKPDKPEVPEDPPKKPDKPEDPPKKLDKPEIPPKKAEDPPKKAEDPPKKVEDPPKKENAPPAGTVFPRRALVISVNNYLYLNPINAGSTQSNGRNIGSFVNVFGGGLKIHRDQIALLSDAAPSGAGRAPLKGVIVNTISNFLATSRPQDRIVILFVGHATEIDNEAFLIPVDGDPNDKEALIELDWLYKQMDACKARQKVLILDVCRLNPTRNPERAGGEPMGEKLDAKLKAPPAGVQVWSACVAGQNSFEFSNDAFNNGLFLEQLHEVLARGLDGTIQRPENAFPLTTLVDAVNSRMKAILEPFKKEQTSRLTGQEAEQGAAYDPAKPLPPRPEIAPPPVLDGGAARLEVVRDLLKDIEIPPVKPSRDQTTLKPESLPQFSAKVLNLYPADGDKNAFREAVEKARDLLVKQIKDSQLPQEFAAPANENQFKEQVIKPRQMNVAVLIEDLKTALDDLRALKGESANQPRRWQANYDYVLSRLEARLAYLIEYSSMLGQMRQNLPAREPGDTGWRLAPLKDPQGDKEGKDATKRSRALLDKLAKEHPGTPWEVIAKRDSFNSMGLEWQSVKVGGR